MEPTHTQTHAAGRHLAVAEALLRGYEAKLEGSQTYIRVNGHKVRVQVAGKGGWIVDDVDRYTSATDEFIILVDLTEGVREFYIAPGDQLRRAVRKDHDEWLTSHGGKRPRTPDSKQKTIYPELVRRWRNGWKRLA